MAPKGSGKVPSRINMVVDLLENPFDVMKKRNRIKDLLFPHDVLPPDIDRSTLMENLQVLVRPEGGGVGAHGQVAFSRGGYEIPEPARAILSQVALMLWETSADVNIAGYTDDVPGATVDNYELSGLRALAVLQYFLEQGMRRPGFPWRGTGLTGPWRTTPPPRGGPRTAGWRYWSRPRVGWADIDVSGPVNSDKGADRGGRRRRKRRKTKSKKEDYQAGRHWPARAGHPGRRRLVRLLEVSRARGNAHDPLHRGGRRRGRGGRREADGGGGRGEVVTLPTFLVNLADPLGRRYLKLTVEVEVLNGDVVEEVNMSEAKVRDAIILLLSSKSYTDLASLESKILLKNEIVKD